MTEQSSVFRSIDLSRTTKRLIALTLDVFLCATTVMVAFYLRLGMWIRPVDTQWLSVVAAIVIAIPLFVTFGFYRAIFRYSGWSSLIAVARAGTIYGLIYAAIFTILGVKGVPRTIGIIQPILLFLAVGGSRALVRVWFDGGFSRLVKGDGHRVLIYGAGAAGRQLAAALANSREMRVVGFVDDDPTLRGSIMNGKTIHAPTNLAKLVKRLGVTDVLLALPSATRKRRNEILDMMRDASVSVRTLPGLTELARGQIAISDVRELEIEDLLGRDAVAPEGSLLRAKIFGKTVLVTGAGGSIGSELCRQILAIGPKRLLLLDMNEYGLYTIHKDLVALCDDSGTGQSDVLIPLLGSVVDEVRMRRIIATWHPDIIYHAAAYKHVPLVEQNPVEGVTNNVFGTLTAAKCAAEARVSDFVLVSTDKAVRPTNIMGTSKRLAELILQALSRENPDTRFSMVRFGNVLGSSGSVVPLFRHQIMLGGPVTVTHEDVTRYFMTIPEAAQLVIQASAMAASGEVFLLDMGEPVRIIDLARRMVELSGMSVRDAENPDGEIEIDVIGLRNGEKLYEELLIDEDSAPTGHPRIMKANESFVPWNELSAALSDLKVKLAAGDAIVIRAALQQLVPEFVPDTNLADWVAVENASGASDRLLEAVR